MRQKVYDLWVDISNTPQVHVVRSILSSFNGIKFFITSFDRGEVRQLIEVYGLKGRVFGSDNYNPSLKSISFAFRTLRLFFMVPNARSLLSIENAMSLPAAKSRHIKSILVLDNDLKFDKKRPFFQKIESWIKDLADFVLVPKVAEGKFKKNLDNVICYPGYKEQIYIADFIPDLEFKKLLPFEEYVIIRPESLSSLYVLHDKSIVPELAKLFCRENINIVYLPRNNLERQLVKGFKNVYVSPKALDGLSLIYYSKAVLTGSGTMGREAALMGLTAVSFFPGTRLLAVDKNLVEEGRLFHSRDPKEIVGFVTANWKRKSSLCSEIEKAKRVKEFIVKLIKKVIYS
ncbi:MAG: DUF354 domain-containing protein [Nitrososphaeria archaeon]